LGRVGGTKRFIETAGTGEKSDAQDSESISPTHPKSGNELFSGQDGPKEVRSSSNLGHHDFHRLQAPVRCESGVIGLVTHLLSNPGLAAAC